MNPLAERSCSPIRLTPTCCGTTSDPGDVKKALDEQWLPKVNKLLKKSRAPLLIYAFWTHNEQSSSNNVWLRLYTHKEAEAWPEP